MKSFSLITYLRQRWRKARKKFKRKRRGFWRKLKNPQTWRLAVSAGLLLYRIIRWLRGILEFFE